MSRRVVTAPISSVTTSPPIPLDAYHTPFNVGLGVVSTGTATYSVEHTYDDVLTGAAVTWFTLSTMSGKTTSADATYQAPVSAVRLNVTAYTSGTVTMTLIQAGPDCG